MTKTEITVTTTETPEGIDVAVTSGSDPAETVFALAAGMASVAHQNGITAASLAGAVVDLIHTRYAMGEEGQE